MFLFSYGPCKNRTESRCFDPWISPEPLNSNWNCFSQEVLNALEDLNRTHTAGMHSDGQFCNGNQLVLIIIF